MRVHRGLSGSSTSRRIKQTGKGKGDAVRKGFADARGDVLMILDADLTVPPEDLPKFYDALAGGKGEFINGSRLVYPMEKQAMRFLNMLGNRFFRARCSPICSTSASPTRCAAPRCCCAATTRRSPRNRAYFGDFDPFGDFDLIFGAAKLNLKIAEVPIRYAAREYGETNISRFRHGWLLLRMVVFAFMQAEGAVEHGRLHVADIRSPTATIWQRKPALRAVYGDIYRRIGAQMAPGRTLEIGGGSGNLKALRAATVSTDIQSRAMARCGLRRAAAAVCGGHVCQCRDGRCAAPHRVPASRASANSTACCGPADG